MFSEFFNLIYRLKDGLSMFGSILIIVAGLAGIGLTIYLAVKIPNKIASIAVTALGVFLCMIPVITSFNALVDKQATSDLAKKYQAELARRKVELDLLEQKEINAKQEIIKTRQQIGIESLESEVRLLKNAQLQMNDYTEITELNLLETNLKQTSVDRKITRPLQVEKWTEGMWWWKEDKERASYDEAIVIWTHDIVAKFGFDMKEIRIANSQEMQNTILVSGVKPKFTGETKDKHHKELAEVRTTYLNPKEIKDTFGYIEGVSIENIMKKNFYKEIWINSGKDRVATDYADICREEFNERLLQGVETKFMEEPIKKLSEKFLKLILAPLNKKIIFVDKTSEDALGLEDYLKNQIESLENKKLEIENKSDDDAIKELDKEVKKELNPENQDNKSEKKDGAFDEFGKPVHLKDGEKLQKQKKKHIAFSGAMCFKNIFRKELTSIWFQER